MIVVSDRLSAKERAALLALLSEARKLSNPELKERVGFTLDGPPRRRLNNLKLVESEKPGRAYFHELTPAGLEWCESELSAGPGQGGESMERALYAVLAGLGRHLARTGQSLKDIFSDGQGATTVNNGLHAVLSAAPVDVSNRIRTAYGELAEEPGDFVRLHELRVKLADIPRADLDAALSKLYQEQRINLVARANQEVLTDDDRDSALPIGGSRKHRISIGRP
jgi:hypothetical protein